MFHFIFIPKGISCGYVFPRKQVSPPRTFKSAAPPPSHCSCFKWRSCLCCIPVGTTAGHRLRISKRSPSHQVPRAPPVLQFLCVSGLRFLCVPFHRDLLSFLMVLVFVFFQTREFSANSSWTIFVLRFTFFLSTGVWYRKSRALSQQFCRVTWVLPSGMSWHYFRWVIFPSATEPVCVLFILCRTLPPSSEFEAPVSNFCCHWECLWCVC